MSDTKPLGEEQQPVEAEVLTHGQIAAHLENDSLTNQSNARARIIAEAEAGGPPPLPATLMLGSIAQAVLAVSHRLAEANELARAKAS
jgi:hypothetical protein